jgi:hypothetical protein
MAIARNAEEQDDPDDESAASGPEADVT